MGFKYVIGSFDVDWTDLLKYMTRKTLLRNRKEWIFPEHELIMTDLNKSLCVSTMLEIS